MSYLDTLVKDLQNELEHFTYEEYVIVWFDKTYFTPKFTSLIGLNLRDIVMDYCERVVRNETRNTDFWLNCLEDPDSELRKILPPLFFETMLQDLEVHDLDTSKYDIFYYLFEKLPEKLLIQIINENLGNPQSTPEYIVSYSDHLLQFLLKNNVITFYDPAEENEDGGYCWYDH
jgi:hypothetical protein